MEPIEEAETFRSAQRGDPEAIQELVAGYQRSIFGLCYRMLGERTEAEDATQETLVKAITHLDTFDPERPFKPWVLRIASNECIDRLRRRKPKIYLEGMGEDGAWEWQPGESPNPEVEVLHKEQRDEVRALLDHLSPTDRNVVSLFYWSGFSYADISDITGLTVSAIKSRLFRARRKMAQIMTQEEAYAA